jgi:hypothetical protein
MCILMLWMNALLQGKSKPETLKASASNLPR